MTKAKKAKAKSTRRDLFDFEHVDATIKVSRDDKGAIERDNRCDKAKLRKQKRPKTSIVATMNANTKTFNEEMKKIYEDMRSIITKQTTKKAMEKTTTTFATSATFAIIKATTKKIILVDDDDEFDANDGDDANSNDD